MVQNNAQAEEQPDLHATKILKCHENSRILVKILQSIVLYYNSFSFLIAANLTRYCSTQVNLLCSVTLYISLSG